MCLSIHKTTFSCDTNGCQDIVTRHHDCADVRSQEFFQNSCSRGLELVFKNDETNKIEITLNFSSGHLLSLDPAKLLEMTASNTNDTITLMSIPGQ